MKLPCLSFPPISFCFYFTICTISKLSIFLEMVHWWSISWKKWFKMAFYCQPFQIPSLPYIFKFPVTHPYSTQAFFLLSSLFTFKNGASWQLESFNLWSKRKQTKIQNFPSQCNNFGILESYGIDLPHFLTPLTLALWRVGFRSFPPWI